MKALFYLSIGLAATAILLLVYRRHQFRNRPPHDYRDNYQYAEQVNLQAEYRSTGDLVMLGDSHCYKAQWEELLGRPVVNRGIGSDVVEGFYRRLEYVLNVKPSICFIEGGANDIAFRVPTDTTIHYLTAIIDTLQAHHITPVLHTVIYSTNYIPLIDRLNHAIVRLAKEKHIGLIDLNPMLSSDHLLKSFYAQPDGSHLTGAAYRVWSNEIKKILHEKEKG